MPINRTIILADDLTGANDTAIQFVNRGLSALVITHPERFSLASYKNYEVIAVSTNSRGMSADDAYNAVRETIRKGKTANGDFFYKKIDSVLRGNPGGELAAVMDEIDISLAIAAPSFPANQSILAHGKLSSGAGVVDAVQVFSAGMNRKVESIPLEEIRRGEANTVNYIMDRHAGGVSVFLADAVNEADLELVYRSSMRLGKPSVLAGAAAFANHIAASMENSAGKPSRPVDLVALRNNGPSLVIAGTRQGETAAQVTTLSRILSIPIIRFKVDWIIEDKISEAISEAFDEVVWQMRRKQDMCIIAVESMFKSAILAGDVARTETEAECGVISGALGALTRKVLDAFDFSVMLCTGGDTSLGVCSSLGIAGIQPVAEIYPGIPIGKIIGGPHEGRYIITKSGRFGNNRSLLEITRYLGINGNKGETL
ncbi:MAG: four-carbon acid sugar kinase family protein [Spirochaetaceae bacterium]|jgi:uncharacterized protein YgbK (DUF1537 family)|nr:four-carbon acid sugar kinase family protein [Spirochaetaceae bacterium]